MNQRFDTILKSGTVTNQEGEAVRDIGIANGRIAEIGGPGGGSARPVNGARGAPARHRRRRAPAPFWRARTSTHDEDEYRLNDRKALRVEGDPRSHPLWRDETAALTATERLVKLARESGKRIHVLHISTRQEIEFLRDHKDVASCEATPHHLTLVAPECYERLGTRAQMNPPVRSADHRDGIWRGIEQGIIDVLGSDHAPHTLEEKAKTYPASPSGMTGVQTLVPLMLDHVNAGRLSLKRFVDLTSAGPARLFNIACQGRIAAGYDAAFRLITNASGILGRPVIGERKRRRPSDGYAGR